MGGPATATPARQPTVLDAAARAAFGAVARMRGERALHPLGRAHEAELLITADADRLPSVDVLQHRGPRRVIVRLSRGAGLPSPVPDAIGLAIRWPDAYGTGRHQDLLLTSSADVPLLNHVPVPRSSLDGVTLSSLLPYEVGGRRLLFGARVLDPDPGAADTRLTYAGLRIELMLGTRLGRFHPIGVLRLREPLSPRLDEELHFDPWNTGPGIRPAGWWNRLRASAYAGSRRGGRKH